MDKTEIHYLEHSIQEQLRVEMNCSRVWIGSYCLILITIS